MTKKEIEMLKIERRKYNYVHYLRKYGFDLDLKTKEIFTAADCFENIPRGPRWYVGQLLNVGFVIQYKLV